MEKKDDTSFILHVASSEAKEETHQIKVKDVDATLTIKYGDYSEALKKAAASLTEVCDCAFASMSLRLTGGNELQAKKYAANTNQEEMLDGYIESYVSCCDICKTFSLMVIGGSHRDPSKPTRRVPEHGSRMSALSLRAI